MCHLGCQTTNGPGPPYMSWNGHIICHPSQRAVIVIAVQQHMLVAKVLQGAGYIALKLCQILCAGTWTSCGSIMRTVQRKEEEAKMQRTGRLGKPLSLSLHEHDRLQCGYNSVRYKALLHAQTPRTHLQGFEHDQSLHPFSWAMQYSTWLFLGSRREEDSGPVRQFVADIGYRNVTGHR